jgi:glutamyl-tRNA reductase
MSSTSKRSVQLQTNQCISSGCNLTSELICRHCNQQYCQLCFMCHRKYLIDDMHSISEQMLLNRRQGAGEVISFIDKQTKDAHKQARNLIDDAIDRIMKASENIYKYIENRRQAKVSILFSKKNPNSIFYILAQTFKRMFRKI